MSDTPLFSIITVTRNNLAGLQKTHASLTAQTFQECEWLVIDGASSDGSTDYLSTTNATWTSEPDHGIYDAMNKGIERASGLYLVFLNAGDTLAAPDTLQNLATYISERDLLPDFIYGDAYEEGLDGTQNYKPARPYRKIALGMFTHHQAMLYRREALGPLRYNQNYKIAADYDLTCRFLQTTNNVLYTPSPLCLFEPGGLSQTNTKLGRQEQLAIKQNLKLCAPLRANLIYIAQVTASLLKESYPQLYWRFKSSDSTASEFEQT